MDLFAAADAAAACKSFGLIINTPKTVVMHQPTPTQPTMCRKSAQRGLTKRLFYGDVITGSHRQEGQIRRYKDILKTSLKRLQINPANWEDLPRDRLTWKRTVKAGGAIYSSPPRKSTGKHTNLIYASLATPTLNRPNVSTVSADITNVKWTCWTPSDQLQHLDCTNRRLSVHLSLASHAVNKRRPPSRTTTTILLLHCLNVCRYGVCRAHQQFTQP
ncbi:hypothetical protein SprV_0100129500 [Sparganum proliferum]